MRENLIRSGHGRIIHRRHGDRQALHRGGVLATIGSAAAVAQLHRHGGDAVSVGGRREGQRAAVAQSRLDGEQDAVVVGYDEGEGLTGFIGRAGPDV